MKNFGVYLNPGYTGQEAICDLICDLRRDHKLSFFGFKSQSRLLSPVLDQIIDDRKSSQELDCILVFGGDGTMLRAKDIALRTGAPLLGINLGYLGFLSESTLTDLKKSIKDLLRNKYKLQQRMLLSVILRHGGRTACQGLALNDAVVFKGDSARLMSIRIYNSGRYVVDTRCDGVIASTPTGSTAYSLSAGGPILSPVMQAIVVSPLNPHILSIRPMVYPSTDKLTFRVYGLDNPAWLQIDGINVHAIGDEDELTVTAARQHVNFIKLSNRTFYKILRNKMHLGK